MMKMKIRILLAEDDKDIRQLTRARLEHEGFEVVTAADGEQVLHEVAECQPIDVILLDVRMPKFDGLEVCRRLKAQPATERIPIIIFTASAAYWQRLVDQCIELGVSDWLKKPFRSQDLVEKIRRVLGREGRADD